MNTEQYHQPEPYSVFEEIEQERPLIYASTGQRFLNYLIDLALFYVVSFLVGLLLAVLQNLTGADLVGFMVDEYGEKTIGLYVFSISLYLSLYLLIEGFSKGRTLGKLITGTRAMKEDGNLITWKEALQRTLCRIIPFEPLSALGGHPWHDNIPKTMVIKTRNINA
jgi:uncharacterized RDD family membrane protein YckC